MEQLTRAIARTEIQGLQYCVVRGRLAFHWWHTHQLRITIEARTGEHIRCLRDRHNIRPTARIIKVRAVGHCTWMLIWWTDVNFYAAIVSPTILTGIATTRSLYDWTICILAAVTGIYNRFERDSRRGKQYCHASDCQFFIYSCFHYCFLILVVYAFPLECHFFHIRKASGTRESVIKDTTIILLLLIVSAEGSDTAAIGFKKWARTRTS
jgi:hypothetical protein